MCDLSATLKDVYGARSAVIVPGGGTYGMEAVARQFATGKRCLVLRNGWFSYRWTQVFETGGIAAESGVLKARRTGEGRQAPFAPAPIEAVEAVIRDTRPQLVIAPHIETGFSVSTSSTISTAPSRGSSARSNGQLAGIKRNHPATDDDARPQQQGEITDKLRYPRDRVQHESPRRDAENSG